MHAPKSAGSVVTRFTQGNLERSKLNRHVWGGFILSAMVLVWLTLRWHIPILLWDHLDIVPIYQAWQDGDLGASEFWKVHDGSHLHTAAYAILLLTTWVSHGQTWLDCLVSVAVLAVCGLLLVRMAIREFEGRLSPGWILVFVFLALYPAHLINLQWGWQVAVFVSLLGVIAPVYLLTSATLRWPANLCAVVCATVGVLGFSTALAAFPVAVWLIIRHRSHPLGLRLSMCLPWLVAVIWLFMLLRGGNAGSFVENPDIVTLSRYVLNYLGSGLMHFSNEMAPVFAVIAMGTAIWAILRVRLREDLVPWVSLMGLSVGFAIMTAWGRATLFGAEHGFMPRYASFSVLFWIGWFGVMLAAFRDAPHWPWVRALLLLCVCAAAFNGLHLAKKAVKVSERSQRIAVQIQQGYPHVDQQVLTEAYDWRSKFAEERLRTWHRYGFAPFEDQPL